MFTGYSIAAFFGQRTASSIAATNNGDFSKAVYIAIDGCMIGVTLLLVFKLAATRTRRCPAACLPHS
jgi:OFA family oxalate/formate antiporter-like MFS transporter